MISMVRVLFAWLALLALSNGAGAQQMTPAPAFPGAVGWGAQTIGGRGGQIIRVTNLNSEGAGSFRAAIETPGPRIIVFEVGGIIDLNRHTLVIREPNATIAGQTAPSPGVTFVRGGMDIYAHDVIV